MRLRLDKHRFFCSSFAKQTNVLRPLYRELLLAEDPIRRREIVFAIERECCVGKSDLGRKRFSCSMCRRVARLRQDGARAFWQNFRFFDDSIMGENLLRGRETKIDFFGSAGRMRPVLPVPQNRHNVAGVI